MESCRDITYPTRLVAYYKYEVEIVVLGVIL